MSTALGISAAIIPAAAGGQTLYTTVVSTDAELAAALSTDGGDTFIRAGTYTVDLDTVVFDTTPRRFVGAGVDEVVIEWTATGAASPDFSAGRTQTDGVIFEHVTFTSATAFVGPGLIQGLWAGAHLKAVGTAGLTSNGFYDCWQLMSCQATGISGIAFGAGFALGISLVRCSVIGFDGIAFFGCLGLTECLAIPATTVGILADDAAFWGCANGSGCSADYSDVTVVNAIHHGFFLTSRISSSDFAGPVGGLVNLSGFASCESLTACRSDNGESNYGACTDLSACTSRTATVFGFDGCGDLGGCLSDEDATGYFSCTQLGGCRANAAATGAGFSGCAALAGCRAQGGASHGFEVCSEMTGCWSDTNGGNGFDACVAIAGLNATGITGFDYANVCDRVSSARGDAAGTGLTDGSNTAVDPVTAAGI